MIWTMAKLIVQDYWGYCVRLYDRWSGPSFTLYQPGKTNGVGPLEGRPYTSNEQEKDPIRRLLSNAPKTYVVAIECHPNDVVQMGLAIRNCLVVNWTNRLNAKQWHFLPLQYYVALQALYLLPDRYHEDRHSGDNNKYNTPRQEVEAFVDGKPYPFLDICLQCSKKLERATGLCSPLFHTCTKTFPKFDLTVNPQIDYDWFSDHTMNLEDLPGVHKDMGDICLKEAFKAADVTHISTDATEVKKHRDVLSHRSKKAALSRRMKNHVCKGCIEREKGCWQWHCNYHKECDGPFYLEDLRRFSRQCEPWMVHALMMSDIDARKHVEGWSKSRIKNMWLAGPNKHDSTEEPYYNYNQKAKAKPMGKYVLVVKPLSNRYESKCLKYPLVCKLAGEKCCTTWKELETRFKGEIPDHVKATAFLIFSRSIRWHKRKNMYGYDSWELIDARLEGHRVRLTHGRSYRQTRAVGSLQSLWDLYYVSQRVLPWKWAPEEDQLRKLVQSVIRDEGVLVGGDAMFAWLQAHPDCHGMTAGQVAKLYREEEQERRKKEWRRKLSERMKNCVDLSDALDVGR